MGSKTLLILIAATIYSVSMDSGERVERNIPHGQKSVSVILFRFEANVFR
jgi:hypothetical protein